MLKKNKGRKRERGVREGLKKAERKRRKKKEGDATKLYTTEDKGGGPLPTKICRLKKCHLFVTKESLISVISYV